MLISAYSLLLAGFISLGLASRPEPAPGTFIESKDLTRAEMTQVLRLLRPTAREPWFIYGFRYESTARAKQTRLSVYLQPDLENGPMRRGRMLVLDLFSPSVGGRSSRIVSTSQYAHIVAAGRRRDDVSGRWDVHRPFVVDGDFSDRTILNIVALIRRSPDGPRLPNGDPAAKVNGSLPISRIRRTEDGIEVTLNRDAYQGEYVTLQDRNGRLVVVKHTMWIV